MQPEPVGPARGPFFWPGPSPARPGGQQARASTARRSEPYLGRTPGPRHGTGTARSNGRPGGGPLPPPPPNPQDQAQARRARPSPRPPPAPPHIKDDAATPPNPNHSLDLSPPARRTRSLVRVSSRLSALALDPSAAARLRPSPAPVTTPTLLHLPPSSSPRLLPPYSPFLYSVLSISPDYVSSCYCPVPPPLAVDSSL